MINMRFDQGMVAAASLVNTLLKISVFTTHQGGIQERMKEMLFSQNTFSVKTLLILPATRLVITNLGLMRHRV